MVIFLPSRECILCCVLPCQVCDSFIQCQERQAVTYIQHIKENGELRRICWRWKTSC